MTRRNQKVRYAVVGLGNIAQTAILPAFEHAKENSELAALISSDGAKRDELGRRYGVQLRGSYDDLETIAREGDVQAVYLAVPNSLHRPLTERAARAGLHVLCEKPMAITEKACADMLRATRSCGVKLMIAYRLHFEKANLGAIRRIQSGEIGDPKIFTSVFCHQVRENDIRTRDDLGGGALYDMGVYCINAARYLFKDDPIEVLAEQTIGTDERFREVDEMTAAILRFRDNRVAQFAVSQGAADVSEFRVVGTRGNIRLEPAYDYSTKLREFVTVDEKTRGTTFSLRDQFAPEILYFSKCILEGLEPEPSGEEGLADVRIMQAVLRSAKAGTKVVLPPFMQTPGPDPSMEMTTPPVIPPSPVHAPSPSK